MSTTNLEHSWTASATLAYRGNIFPLGKNLFSALIMHDLEGTMPRAREIPDRPDEVVYDFGVKAESIEIARKRAAESIQALLHDNHLEDYMSLQDVDATNDQELLDKINNAKKLAEVKESNPEVTAFWLRYADEQSKLPAA